MVSQNRLSTIMKRIIDSDYSSIGELFNSTEVYSIGEIHAFLNKIIAAWTINEITPGVVYTLLKFVYIYLNSPRIQINFKNQTPIPICYFSSYLLPSASLLYSYLITSSLAVTLFPLDKTDRHLKEYIEKQKPPVVIMTISQFLDVHPLRLLVQYFHGKNLKIVVGGIPFVYDKSLKENFSTCVFPDDLAELTVLLENSLKRDTDEKI